jgi:hypothetical protein
MKEEKRIKREDLLILNKPNNLKIIIILVVEDNSMDKIKLIKIATIILCSNNHYNKM